MKIARFLVTKEFLRELLHLPLDAEIVTASGGPGHCIEFVVRDEGLQDVDVTVTTAAPLVEPTWKKNQPVEFVGWNQK